jgi:hypothetical protein
MSLKPSPIEPVPEETARIARAYASGEGRGGEDLTAVIGMHPSGMPPEPHSRSAGM